VREKKERKKRERGKIHCERDRKRDGTEMHYHWSAPPVACLAMRQSVGRLQGCDAKLDRPPASEAPTAKLQDVSTEKLKDRQADMQAERQSQTEAAETTVRGAKPTKGFSNLCLPHPPAVPRHTSHLRARHYLPSQLPSFLPNTSPIYTATISSLPAIVHGGQPQP